MNCFQSPEKNVPNSCDIYISSATHHIRLHDHCQSKPIMRFSKETEHRYTNIQESKHESFLLDGNERYRVDSQPVRQIPLASVMGNCHY